MFDGSFDIRQIQRRVVITLFTVQSLVGGAMIGAFTVTSIVAAQLSGSDSLAGVPGTLLMLGRAGAAYPVGWLMDRAGRRVGLSAGLVMAVAGLVLSGLAVAWGSFVFFCLGALLLGMGRSASEQTRFIVAEVFPESRRARMMGVVVFAGTVGSVGGPFLVVPATGLARSLGMPDYAGAFLLGAGLVALATLVAFALLRPDPKVVALHLARGGGPGVGEKGDPEAGLRALRGLRAIFRRRAVWVALAAMVIGQLVMTLLMVITPLHMHRMGHGTPAISGVIMAHTLGMFGLSGLTGWLIDRLGRVPMIGVGGGILALSGLLAPVVTGVVGLGVALFLLGLGWNFCYIAGSSLLSDALEAHERGRVQGLSEGLVALASGMGSLGTGGVFAAGGLTAVAGVGLAFSLVLIALIAWAGLRRPLPVDLAGPR